MWMRKAKGKEIDSTTYNYTSTSRLFLSVYIRRKRSTLDRDYVPCEELHYYTYVYSFKWKDEKTTQVNTCVRGIIGDEPIKIHAPQS